MLTQVLGELKATRKKPAATVTALNAEAEKRALPLSFIAGDVTSAADVR